MPLEAIAGLPTETFSEGATVITGGTRPERLYFLQSGRVEVVRDGVRVALIKTPGSVIGEISLLLGVPTTADVVAVEKSVLAVAEEPLQFLLDHPEVNLAVAKTLAHRLDAASKYLVDVREQLRDCSDHIGMVDGILDSIFHRDLKSKVPQ